MHRRHACGPQCCFSYSPFSAYPLSPHREGARFSDAWWIHSSVVDKSFSISGTPLLSTNEVLLRWLGTLMPGIVRGRRGEAEEFQKEDEMPRSFSPPEAQVRRG